MLKNVLRAAVVAAALIATGAATAQAGNAAMPIELKMRRGTDEIVVHGVLRQNLDCCTYLFAARAGQKLYWSESGAAARLVITPPHGDAEGPGFENPYLLTQTGLYTLSVSPDLMADGAFGPFTLKLRIPPL